MKEEIAQREITVSPRWVEDGGISYIVVAGNRICGYAKEDVDNYITCFSDSDSFDGFWDSEEKAIDRCMEVMDEYIDSLEA